MLTPLDPARVVYRWDLDKTYLRTEFDSIRDLLRTAVEPATRKRTVPGASVLLRELRATDPAAVFILSGSPEQMRRVLEAKLRLDGIRWDSFTLKPSLDNLMKGRFRVIKDQVSYKLEALLSARVHGERDHGEILFGDDAEADAFIYSLYADMVARRVNEPVVHRVLQAAEVYPDDIARIITQWQALPQADPVRRIFIMLDRLTPPAYFAKYGPRVVPIFNYFQAALVLLGDKHLTAGQVLKVMLELVQTSGYNLLTLSNSFQDLLRRGLPIADVAQALLEAMQGPAAMLQVVRPVPDIIAAFSKRVASLGAQPAPPRARELDYLSLLDDARPRTHKKRKRFE